MRSLTEQPIHCPYCGEPVTVVVDHSVGDQEYIEDCQVCCRPMVLHISIDADGEASVSVRYENE